MPTVLNMTDTNRWSLSSYDYIVFLDFRVYIILKWWSKQIIPLTEGETEFVPALWVSELFKALPRKIPNYVEYDFSCMEIVIKWNLYKYARLIKLSALKRTMYVLEWYSTIFIFFNFITNWNCLRKFWKICQYFHLSRTNLTWKVLF